MKALLHQPIYDTFKFRPDLKSTPEILPRQRQGRTLSWQTTLSYPSPPMSSPPSPQKKPIDNPNTSVSISHADTPTTTATNYLERPTICLPPIQTGAPSTAPHSLSEPLISRLESATSTTPLIPRLPRISTSFDESQAALVRTESTSSTSAAVDTQATAGPSTATSASTTGRGGRRSKTHVANACNNCKRAHLSCDVERPCNRCTQTGKADTCRDVPHKKRGRPRLRDEGDFRIIPAQDASHEAGSSIAGPSTAAGRGVLGSRHRRRGSLRTLRSYPNTSGPLTPMAPPQSILGPKFSLQPRAPHLAHGLVTPMAFLDLDLVILKANSAFQNLMGVREAKGMRLVDIATPQEGDSFQSTRNSLRAEREAKEPAYLPPIIQPGIDPVHGISLTDQDIDEVTRGFDDQHYNWTFRLSGGERNLAIRIRLAKTSVYFVTLFLPPLPETQLEQALPPSLQASGHPQQFYHSSPVSIPGPQVYQGSPTRQFVESPFPGREGIMQTAPQSPFYHSQALQQGARAPQPGPAMQPLSRSYPPYEIQQPRYYFQPQPPPPPPQYQQYSYQAFQPPYPTAPLQTIQEQSSTTVSAPPTVISTHSSFLPSSPYMQSYTSTRPRSETMESLGRHVHTRLRADSGVTASSSSAIQSSPLQQRGMRHLRDESSGSDEEGAAAVQGQGPRKRRRMTLDEVLHQR